MNVGEQQGGSESVQDLLRERIGHWELQLMLADESDVTAVGNQAVQELNDLWPYLKVHCSFGGDGVYGEDGPEGEMSIRAGTVHGQGVSGGFVVADFMQIEDHRLYHRFLTETRVVSPHPVIKTTHEMSVYMNMGASIVPSRELEDAVVPTLPNAPTEINAAEYNQQLDMESDNLCRLIGSVAFQQFDTSRRRRLVNRFVSRCEQMYDLRNLGVLLDSTYCLRPEMKQDNSVVHEPVSLEDTIVSGIILGYGAIENGQVWTPKGKKRREIFNSDTGLCLVIDVRQATDPTPLKRSDVIWVPLGNQDLELSYTNVLEPPEIIYELPGGQNDGPDDLIGA